MFFKNARIYGTDFQFHNGAFEVSDGRFGAVLPNRIPENALDLNGATVIPGLIDIHLHGNSGKDFSDGDYAGLKTMARSLLHWGITSFTPTSMTLPYSVLEKAFAAGRRVAEEACPDEARVMGFHMEGPYFSMKKKGAQNGAYLKDPDFEGFKQLYHHCGNLIKIVDVAPELPGAADFARNASKLCTVSVAHTDSDYDHAKEVFASGATHVTHLFNAMPSIHHRNPGVIPAAAENKNVRAELICDGLHVHPASVRLAFQIFGSERMILISDALRCCGMPDGEYELGGQKVFLGNGIARLADGTIAGSAATLMQCMRNAIAFGIPEEDAIRSVTYNPACAIHAEDQIGAIASGKYADFLICNSDYSSIRIFRGGVEVTD